MSNFDTQDHCLHANCCCLCWQWPISQLDINNAFLYSLLISCSHGSVFATHHESEERGVEGCGWARRGISCICLLP